MLTYFIDSVFHSLDKWERVYERGETIENDVRETTVYERRETA